MRRKKQFEHNLEQTTGQISTLDQQIGAIESANINRGTLEAMEQAGQAMKHIHSGLKPAKVDEIMYVLLVWFISVGTPAWLTNVIGRNCASKMRSARKLSRP